MIQDNPYVADAVKSKNIIRKCSIADLTNVLPLLQVYQMQLNINMQS